ncbi:hypothetical protein PTKIN_Ptkin10aG0135100 [Pterospermum kingtungense]
MEMDVVVPAPAVDFNFDSACSSPYMTAPSSPQRFGTCSSNVTHCSSSADPFEWEEKPTGTPKRKGFDGRGLDREEEEEDDQNKGDDGDGCEDFEFNFSGQLERASLSAADELFDCGKIRPLKPPPGYEQFSSTPSPRSPKSRAFRTGQPPQQKQEQDRKSIQLKSQERGRQRSTSGSSSLSSSYNYVHKKSRSLSPLRVSDIMFEEEEEEESSSSQPQKTTNPKSYVSSILSAISFSKGYRKWKLKDLLLFRSASEGRATNYKDPLTKYTLLSKKDQTGDVKSASFRSAESIGSRRRAPVSPHELHYTANRAVSEEMKRKTFLPYKQGLLGCLGFNPGPGMHEISRGIGSLTRG